MLRLVACSRREQSALFETGPKRESRGARCTERALVACSRRGARCTKRAFVACSRPGRSASLGARAARRETLLPVLDGNRARERRFPRSCMFATGPEREREALGARGPRAPDREPVRGGAGEMERRGASVTGAFRRGLGTRWLGLRLRLFLARGLLLLGGLLGGG